MASFLTESERRNEWFNCISAIDNWISRHSVALKSNRLNNGNGIRKCLNVFLNDLDAFMDEQEDLDITV